jgi:hypothetical protein
VANVGNIYAQGMRALMTGGAQLTGHTLKLALVGAGYVPNLATDQFWSIAQSSEFSGPGYTAGGSTLTGTSVTVFTASAWPLSYPASGTAVATGTVIKSGVFFYRAANSGSAASSAPTFPNIEGETVTDGGGIVWTNIGNVILIFTATGGYAWAAISTSNVPYAVIYDSTPGTAATSPLLVLLSFSPAMTNIPAGPVTVNPDTNLGYLALPLF